MIDTDANTVTYRITYAGLSGAPTAGHIHGNATSFPGTNAGVVHGFASLANAISGTWTYSEAQEPMILAGTCYANLHTVNNPGGEIRGQIMPFNAQLDNTQENPATASTGSGWCVATVDTAANTLTYWLSFSGLSGAVTASHFHGNVLHGTNAGVKVGITIPTAGIINTATIAYNEADQFALLEGRWYVNLHTAANPGGEIRGQLVPTVVPMDAGQEVPATAATSSSGFGMVSVDSASTTLSYDVRILSLGTETAAHIHGYAAAGANAGVVNGLVLGAQKKGTWNYTTNGTNVLSGNTYFNVHTTTNPGGEIRGQILNLRRNGVGTSSLALGTSIVGRGTVTTTPEGTFFAPGTLVHLEATPLLGDRFLEWTGEVVGTTPAIDITLVDHHVNLTATFVRDQSGAPALNTASDTPADNGGFVRLIWQRSALDAASTPTSICCYYVERRAPAPAAPLWTRVGELPATTSTTYSIDVPTPFDSSGANSADCRFRVIARAVSDTVQWTSNELEAHSRDNLPPSAPTSVVGTISNGLATFFWPAVSAPDLAGYNIYRASAQAPLPSDFHLVGTVTALGFSDSPGYFAHYQVTSVDTNGNESAATPLVPLNSTDIAGPRQPLALSVSRPTPSPARERVDFSVGFPRAGFATVEILDSQSRVIMRLKSGSTEVGWERLSWKLVDSAGKSVEPGLYFIRARADGVDAKRKVVVLR